MLVGVKLWAVGASDRQRRSRRHHPVRRRSWPGRCMTASPSSAAATPAGRRSRCGGRRNDIIAVIVGTILYLALGFAFHPLVIGLRVFGSLEHVGRTHGDQAADRARYPRPQGRRADRLPHLLSRPYRAHPRPPLRRDPGRRFARHGDARARDHRAGDARHDDPAGPCGDARLAPCAWSWSTCRSAPTRNRRSRPSRPPRACSRRPAAAPSSSKAAGAWPRPSRSWPSAACR